MYSLLDEVFLSATAYSQAAAPAGPQPTVWESLMMPVGLLVIMYFFMIRPQMRKNKERQTLIEGLKAGDEVVTSSGIIGKVKSVADLFVTIEIAPNTPVKFSKTAIDSLTKQTSQQPAKEKKN